MFKILRSTRSSVDFADTVRDGRLRVAGGNYALTIVDLTQLLAEDPAGDALDEIGRRSDVLLLCEQPDFSQLAALFGRDRVRYLIAKATPILAEELVVTANKLLTQDVFGLEKYLTWGIRPQSVVLRDSEERQGAIDDLVAFVGSLGLGARVAATAKIVADELLTNAIYNAPVDGTGARLHAGLRRSERLTLTGRNEVELHYACDGRSLAVSVVDHFGSLDRATISFYLAKCFAAGADQVDDKQGGAGLGMYMALENVSSLVYNLAPGLRTEVIGLIDVSDRSPRSGRCSRSFCVFVTGSQHV